MPDDITDSAADNTGNAADNTGNAADNTGNAADNTGNADNATGTGTADSLVPAWLTLPEVAEALGQPVTRIRQLLTDRQLLAVRRGDNRALMVPADFVQDGRVLKGLPGVLMLLHDARFSEHDALRWLYTDDDLPGPPVQALVDNRGTEVKRRAQALGF